MDNETKINDLENVREIMQEAVTSDQSVIDSQKKTIEILHQERRHHTNAIYKMSNMITYLLHRLIGTNSVLTIDTKEYDEVTKDYIYETEADKLENTITFLIHKKKRNLHEQN